MNGEREMDDGKVFQRLANATVDMAAESACIVKKGFRFTAYRRETGTFRFEKKENNGKEPQGLPLQEA